jgi:hypothetical protein
MRKKKTETTENGAVEVRHDVPLSELKPDPENDRKWSAEALEGLKRTIAELSYVEPIVVNETTGLMVAGHMRRSALIADGKTVAPFVVFGTWTKSRARALAEALNNPANQGRYVLKKTRKNLDALRKSEPDLFVQLGLGTILETAAAQESEGQGKTKKVEFDESLRTIKIRVPLSVWNSHLEAMARAGELCCEKGVALGDLTDAMLIEKIEAEFLTTHGHPKEQPQYSTDEKRKRKTKP